MSTIVSVHSTISKDSIARLYSGGPEAVLLLWYTHTHCIVTSMGCAVGVLGEYEGYCLDTGIDRI